ncbi:MAG: polyprenyl synthetase family protein [Bacteroidales bacterium]|nr:polyprenyl synthetase family protein [Bacteroidales bacterium]
MYTIDKIQKIINDYIDNQKFEGEPKELYAPIEYILRQGGKRLRPTLCLLACDLFGGNIEECMVPAVAAEIFHNFTLVHDDIMDQAPLRRGMETIYKKWGSDVAILSGDTMLIKAFQYVLNTDNKYRYEVFAELCKVALEVCEGQQLDLNFETRDDVTLKEYLEMIRLKTAVLLGSVLKIGAIVAGADKKSQDVIYEFGVEIGMAFQLQDDILDCYADVDVFGKMIGGDISDNKKTYLYLYALDMAIDEDEKELRKLFKMPKGRDEEKIKKVLEIYDRYAVKHEVMAEIEEMFDCAIMRLVTELDVDAERKNVLLDYAKYLYNRNK